MDKVMAQLEGLVAHYEELQEMMADPEVINDTKRYMEISKEEADMREVVQKYRKYKSDIKEIDDNKEIISTESDNDLVEMAKEENSELESVERLLQMALRKGFKDYRSRVVERFGKELDKELKYNIKAKEIETTVVDENGEEKVVKETVNVADPNRYSEFARFFDDGCTGWSKDPEFNLMFLRRQQDYANEKLRKRGYLFLNEVYAMLGMDATKAGQIVGWIYDEKHPIGDNYVDFNIYNGDSERARAFVNGKERSILLDFNVDGNILDMI